MLSELSPDQRELAEYMSELSEKAYHAGWYQGLEFDLWNAVTSGPQQFGRLNLTQEHIQRLRELSKQCGGWIIFDDEHEHTWVPILKWKRRYEQQSEQRTPN